MRRVLIYIGITFTVLIICFFLGMHIGIGHGIKERIKIAKELYPGTAEDALIAYLLDEKNSTRARTDVAIWTLGQIRSRKALPVLYGLYKNDPAGKTCKGRHSHVLCQYGIHKAIVSIENNWLGAKEKNWFGSWSGLNK